MSKTIFAEGALQDIAKLGFGSAADFQNALMQKPATTVDLGQGIKKLPNGDYNVTFFFERNNVVVTAVNKVEPPMTKSKLAQSVARVAL